MVECLTLCNTGCVTCIWCFLLSFCFPSYFNSFDDVDSNKCSFRPQPRPNKAQRFGSSDVLIAHRTPSKTVPRGWSSKQPATLIQQLPRYEDSGRGLRTRKARCSQCSKSKQKDGAPKPPPTRSENHSDRKDPGSRWYRSPTGRRKQSDASIWTARPSHRNGETKSQSGSASPNEHHHQKRRKGGARSTPDDAKKKAARFSAGSHRLAAPREIIGRIPHETLRRVKDDTKRIADEVCCSRRRKEAGCCVPSKTPYFEAKPHCGGGDGRVTRGNKWSCAKELKGVTTETDCSICRGSVRWCDNPKCLNY